MPRIRTLPKSQRLPESSPLLCMTEETTPLLSSSMPLLKEIQLGASAAWRVVTLAGPMAASYTFSAMLFTDALLIGRIGHAGYSRVENANIRLYLAAIPVINTTLQTVTIVAISPFYAMSLIGSKRLGNLRKLTTDHATEVELCTERQAIRDVFRSGAGLSLLLLTPTILAFSSSYELLKTIGVQENIATLTSEYLVTYSISIPFFFLRMISEQMLFAYGKTFPAMIIGLINFAIGTGASFYLTFGPPNMGIRGVALGYVLESCLTGISYGLFVGLHPDYRPLKLYALDNFNHKLLATLREMLIIGLPITLQIGSELIIWQLLNTFAAWLGTKDLAAQAFTSQLQFFAIIPSFAFGQSVSQEVGRAVGASEFTYASRVARYGLITSAFVVAIPTILLASHPEWLGKILTHKDLDHSLLATVKQIMPLAAATIIADTFRYGQIQVLRISNQNLTPTVLSILFLSVGLALSYFLAFTEKLNIVGIIMGPTIGMALVACAVFPMWRKYTTPEAYQEVKEAAQPDRNPESWLHTCCSFFTRQQPQRDPLLEPLNAETRPVYI